MDAWRTPKEIFNPLNAEFCFDLDAAANQDNALVARYLDNALNIAEWPGTRIWLNPPYGKMIDPFIRRAAEEAAKGKLIVALIPTRTRAAWWHDAVLGAAKEIRFVRKRVKFLDDSNVKAKFTAGCDSVVVIFDGIRNGNPLVVSSFNQAASDRVDDVLAGGK